VKSAQQIQEFLDENAYRFDLGVQYLGDEPNAYRKPWEASSVRALMVASWPYEQCVSGDTVVLAHGVGPVRIQNVVRDVFVDCAGKPQGTSAAIDNGQRDVVRVSAGGRSVVCTPDHRILVSRPKAWRRHGPSRAELVADAPEEWVEAQDVQPGDVLKVYYGQNIWAGERVRLNPPARGSARSPIVFPEELTSDLAYLLGLLATDASIRWQHGSGMSAAVRWTADDPGILAALLEMVPRVFGKTPVVVQREGRSAVVELASTPLVQWLRDSVGVVSRRRVPDTIFASPRDVVAAYLSGVFDGDGFFPVHTYMPGRPQFANTERELVEAVSVLLLNMGCPVSGRSEEVRASALLPQGARYRPIHRLAATWAEDMDWSWMQLHHSTRGVGLEAWKQYRPRQLRKCKARGGVSFVEVESVEPAGSETVWDLTVPSTESFTANGIVVHNSAGNGSIPAVYKTINIARDDFMCDRFYLPATPRDMRLLAKNDIPVFGIESKHPLMDFDVVGTSISYPVLTMSFVKMLSMSGIPVRWKDRDGSHPFVIFGGQAYAAPEVLAPVVDAVFLGEVEDEPGNPGLGAVLERIAQFKEQGRWVTDRVGCYADLAREFSFLYFPRFVEIEYGYQDRGLEHPSKQVVGYRSLIDGMKMPFQRHYVKDLDSIPPLDDPPLLYVDAQNASGDAEVSRGSIASSGSVLIEGQGIRRFSSWQGDDLHPHDADLGEMRADVAGALWPVSHVITSGHREVVRVSTVQGHEVICTPDHEISVVRGPLFDARRARRGEPIPEGAVQFYAKKNVGRLSVLESQDRVWARADGVAVDDVIPVYYGQNIWGQEQIALQSWAVHPLSVLQRLPSVLDEDVAWLLGMLAGDCTVRYKANRPKFSHRLQIKTEDPGVAEKTVRVVERLFGYRVSSRSREGALPQALVWEIRSKDLMEWLAVNFGVIDNVTRRRVPEQIMRSPRDVVASFVAGFYDSDGTYDDRNGRLSWCSQSEELIRDLSLILLNFGAPCSVRVNEPPLGDRGVKLSWKVQALQAPDSEWSWLHPSHTRRLPQVRQWQEWGSKVAGNTARNGVMYCAVTGVTPAGSDDCYDISVPGPVSFTCNGMLVHNCPAWSIPVDAQVEIAGRGSVRFDSVQVGELIRVGSEFHRIRGVVVHGVRDTIRVVTRQGLDVRCTPEHEIYAVRGGASLRRAQRDTAPREWVHAEDLRPGDLMLRTCGGTVWPQHSVVIEHQAALHYVGRGRAERYYDTVWPDLLDDDVAWLLGMVTGDCAIRSNQVEFRIERRAPEIRTRLIEILKGRFDIDVTEVVSLSGKVDHIRANSARLVEWLALNFGLSPRKEFRKVVPEQLFRSPRSVVGSYLSALYDSNGTMLIPRSPESATTIRFVVYSESQIRGIAELLRLLGLPCAIRSTVLNKKRDGSPSAKPSVRWEVRTAGSQDPEAYTWLQSLEPFKSRHIDHFRPSRNGGACVGGLQYVEVVGIEEDAPTRVMDVDVPGPQAFNVSGIQVHNCSFCRLSLVTKPYRQRSPEYMVEFGKSLKQNMGGVHLAYVAPDFPFHSQKKRMTKALMENVTDEVDGAAMRVDDFIADEQFVLLASFAGMDSVTLGLQGGCIDRRETVAVPGHGLLTMQEISELGVAESGAVSSDGYGLRRLDGVQIHTGQGVTSATGAGQTGRCEVQRVLLSNGNSLECTPEHLIQVTVPSALPQYRDSKREQLDNGQLVWKQAQHLVAGDAIRIDYGQEAWATHRHQLCSPERKKYAQEDRLRYPSELTPDLAWLLGLLGSDGDVNSKRIRWRVDDAAVETRVVQLCAELFGVEPSRGYSGALGSTLYLEIVSAPGARWLDSNFGIAQGHKRIVPAKIRTSPRDVVEQFLMGVFDGDGSVWGQNGDLLGIELTQQASAGTFHRDVISLCQNMGLRAVARTRNGRVAWDGSETQASSLLVTAEDGYDWSWVRFTESARALRWSVALEAVKPRVKVMWMTPDDGHYYTKVQTSYNTGVEQDVYDISTPQTGAFTVNGMVVHNSQRMRDLVGKGISDAEVRETVTKALEAGVRKIKLFMISNLPGEDWGDIKQVVRLAEDLAQIRDSMNKPHVVIQLSWTPLLIEANTPFQWFAPTPANYALADAWKELKDLRIDAKIGAKAQVDKVTFFQLCQRASREIGEAMVDVMLDLDVACWGGVPRRMREALDDSLRKWGFLNGLEDAFDERGKDDLFGWEFIDTGVSKELLWSVYQQMVEFLQYTDSATYDELVGQEYHGAEWVPRCDERCQGNACGACDREDLEIRQKMLASAEDESVELGDLTPIDERSVAMKIRARLDKPEQYRLVTNDHWRFNLRRALYRAREATGMSARIAKRTIVFASDAIGYKDWTHGTDYVEFGLTKVESTERVTEFLARVNEELVNPATGQPWMQVQEWVVHPPTSPSIRSDIDLTLYEVEVEETPERVQARLQAWDAAESVDMTIRAPVTYFGPPTEVVNAKEYVEGVWLVRDGHRVTVRMLVRGRPTPYNVFAALMGQKSWLEVAKYPARRVDSFVTWDGDQWDFFRPACEQCGASIPVNVLEEPFDAAKCPMCLDRQITV